MYQEDVLNLQCPLAFQEQQASADRTFPDSSLQQEQSSPGNHTAPSGMSWDQLEEPVLTNQTTLQARLLLLVSL